MVGDGWVGGWMERRGSKRVLEREWEGMEERENEVNN